MCLSEALKKRVFEPDKDVDQYSELTGASAAQLVRTNLSNKLRINRTWNITAIHYDRLPHARGILVGKNLRYKLSWLFLGAQRIALIGSHDGGEIVFSALLQSCRIQEIAPRMTNEGPCRTGMIAREHSRIEIKRNSVSTDLKKPGTAARLPPLAPRRPFHR
jgi:hypothetical protein